MQNKNIQEYMISIQNFLKVKIQDFEIFKRFPTTYDCKIYSLLQTPQENEVKYSMTDYYYIE